MITEFDKYNEGVRAKMTPKPKEEVDDLLSNMSPNHKLTRGSEYGLPWMVKNALASGADVHYLDDIALNMVCDHNYTHMSMEDRKEIVKLLMDAGANMYARDSSAVKYSSIEIEQLLRQYKSYNHDNPYNESVRDKMTPKSSKDINNVVIKKMNKDKDLGFFNPTEWGLTLEDITDDDNDFWEFIFVSTDGRKWELHYNAYDNNPFTMREKKQGVSYNHFSNYKEVENYLMRKGLKKTINESVRDHMTPKSIEDIKVSLQTATLFELYMTWINDVYDSFDTTEFDERKYSEHSKIIFSIVYNEFKRRYDEASYLNKKGIKGWIKKLESSKFYEKYKDELQLNESLHDSLTGKPIEHITNVEHYRRYNFREPWASHEKYRNDVGYIVIDNEYGDELYLSSFTIWEPYKGKGLGRKYLNIVLEDLKQLPYPWVGLSVKRDNEVAIKLYRSVGFRLADEVEEYNGFGKNYKNELYYYMVKENK